MATTSTSDIMQISLPGHESPETYTWHHSASGALYKLKTIKVDGKPYFNAKDLCVGMGYRSIKVISEVSDANKLLVDNRYFLNEEGTRELLNSREGFDAFRKWALKTVLTLVQAVPDDDDEEEEFSTEDLK